MTVQVFTATDVVRHILQWRILFLHIVRTLFLVQIVLIESQTIIVQCTSWWASRTSATLWQAVILKLEVDLRIWSGLYDRWMFSCGFSFLAFIVAPTKVANILATDLCVNLFWSNEVYEVLERGYPELAWHCHMASDHVQKSVGIVMEV